MPRRPVGLLIADMLERIERIRRFVAAMEREAFLRDEKTIDSVVRNLEVIGEAASRLTRMPRSTRRAGPRGLHRPARSTTRSSAGR